MTTAFVLSGGASLGSIQVGMLLALAEAGVTPDLIVGTSVGAVNGGWVASRPGVTGIEGLAGVWRSLSRRDVFPTRPAVGLLGFLGQLPSLVPGTGLRRLLTRHLEFARMEDAPVPLHVVATDVVSGHDVLLSSGDAVDAITASAAIPAILPPVQINGRALMDGGVVNNTPLSHAVALGADVAYVLPTGYACDLSAPPKGVMAIALHALTLAINQRLAADYAVREHNRSSRRPTAVHGSHLPDRLLAWIVAHRPGVPGNPPVAGAAFGQRPGGAARATPALTCPQVNGKR